MAGMVLHAAGDPEGEGMERRRMAAAIAGALAVEAVLVAIVLWTGHGRVAVPPVVHRTQVISIEMAAMPPAPPRPVPRPAPQKAVPPRPVPAPVPVHRVAPAPRPVTHSAAPRPVVQKAPVQPPVPVPPAPAVPPVPKPQPPAPPPVPAPQPPAPPVMTAAEQASLISRYVALVRPVIEQNLRVPGELRAMGMSGRATVEFRVSPAGQVLWARIVKPSPLGAVNRAALAAVKDGDFPAFLHKMAPKDTIFQISIEVGSSG